ncbi:hypothetical protein BLOT_011813 [Blomia tropicalis]|nr:hypothetical protein BLOT_011813 [Blomia tropicalis]
MSHLISIESILNVLIEESSKQSKPASESISQHSINSGFIDLSLSIGGFFVGSNNSIVAGSI